MRVALFLSLVVSSCAKPRGTGILLLLRPDSALTALLNADSEIVIVPAAPSAAASLRSASVAPTVLLTPSGAGDDVNVVIRYLNGNVILAEARVRSTYMRGNVFSITIRVVGGCDLSTCGATQTCGPTPRSCVDALQPTSVAAADSGLDTNQSDGPSNDAADPLDAAGSCEVVQMNCWTRLAPATLSNAFGRAIALRAASPSFQLFVGDPSMGTVTRYQIDSNGIVNGNQQVTRSQMQGFGKHIVVSGQTFAVGSDDAVSLYDIGANSSQQFSILGRVGGIALATDLMIAADATGLLIWRNNVPTPFRFPIENGGPLVNVAALDASHFIASYAGDRTVQIYSQLDTTNGWEEILVMPRGGLQSAATSAGGGYFVVGAPTFAPNGLARVYTADLSNFTTFSPTAESRSFGRSLAIYKATSQFYARVAIAADNGIYVSARPTSELTFIAAPAGSSTSFGQAIALVENSLTRLVAVSDNGVIYLRLW